MTRETRKLLQNQLEQLIASSIKELQPLLQEEQNELGQEKLDKFHRENPGRLETVKSIYKRLRHLDAIEKPRFRTRKPCDHTKNQGLVLKALGYEVPKSPHADFAVAHHIFMDGTEKIWCTVCGQPWFPGQPGWNQALDMLEHSTNRTSTSERVGMKPDGVTRAVYFDPLFANEKK